MWYLMLVVKLYADFVKFIWSSFTFFILLILQVFIDRIKYSL